MAGIKYTGNSVGISDVKVKTNGISKNNGDSILIHKKPQDNKTPTVLCQNERPHVHGGNRLLKFKIYSAALFVNSFSETLINFSKKALRLM